ALRYFRHRRNEVIVFHVLDKNELEFPFQRLTVFEDIEDTAVRVLSDPRAIRAAYLQQMEASPGCWRALDNCDHSFVAPLFVAPPRPAPRGAAGLQAAPAGGRRASARGAAGGCWGGRGRREKAV